MTLWAVTCFISHTVYKRLIRLTILVLYLRILTKDPRNKLCLRGLLLCCENQWLWVRTWTVVSLIKPKMLCCDLWLALGERVGFSEEIYLLPTTKNRHFFGLLLDINFKYSLKIFWKQGYGLTRLNQPLRWLHTVSWKVENNRFRSKIFYIDILLEEWN